MGNFISTLQLPPELKDRSLVGLGEVVHGSGGLHALAAALMKKMIVDFGVRTILFEAPYGAVRRVNEYISRGEQVPISAMTDLYFVWRSRENLAFFNYLAEFNKSASEPVQITGIDIRQPAFELLAIKKYILLKDSTLARLLDEFPFSDVNLASFRDFETAVAKHLESIGEGQASRLQANLSTIEKTIRDDTTLTEPLNTIWTKNVDHR